MMPKVPSVAPPLQHMGMQGDMISAWKICKLRQRFESSEGSCQSLLTYNAEHQTRPGKFFQNL